MRHLWRSIASLVVLLALSVPIVAAQDEEPVTVIGRVSNGTPEGAVPVGATVTLYVNSGERTVSTVETEVSADGIFRFDGVTAPVGSTVAAAVVHQDVEYRSQPVDVGGATEEIELPVAVYETTTDRSTLSVVQWHLAFESAEGELRVNESLTIGNRGSRTVVGQTEIALPEQAVEVTFDTAHGEGLVRQGDFVVGSVPIPPGEQASTVAFGYEVPGALPLSLERGIALPVGSVVVLVPGDVLSVRGEGLVDQGLHDTGVGPIRLYTGGGLDAGRALALTVTADGQSDGPSPLSGALVEVGIGVGALVVSIGAALWFLRRPDRPPRDVRPMIAEIAELDGEFAAGGLAEDAHRRQREALKARLRDVLVDSGGVGGDG